MYGKIKQSLIRRITKGKCVMHASKDTHIVSNVIIAVTLGHKTNRPRAQSAESCAWFSADAPLSAPTWRAMMKATKIEPARVIRNEASLASTGRMFIAGIQLMRLNRKCRAIITCHSHVPRHQSFVLILLLKFIRT